MNSYNQILNELFDIIKDFAPANAKLKEDTEFVADLEFDSVQVMEFLPEVEDYFDILIPLSKVEEIRYISDLANLVLQLTEQE